MVHKKDETTAFHAVKVDWQDYDNALVKVFFTGMQFDNGDIYNALFLHRMVFIL